MAISTIKNELIQELRKDPKFGEYFKANGTYVSYKTGFPTLDYYMGMKVNVFNDAGEVIQRYPCIGIAGGSIVSVIGKTHVGKCQPGDTIIPTPEGLKRLDMLQEGDYVYNRYGKPVKVLNIFDKGEKEVYRVTLTDGRETLCSDNHLWTVYRYNETTPVTKELKELVEEGLITYYYDEKLDVQEPRYMFSLPCNQYVEYPKRGSAEEAYANGVEIKKTNVLCLNGERIVTRDDGDDVCMTNRSAVMFMHGSVEERVAFLRGYLSTEEPIRSAKYEDTVCYQINIDMTTPMLYHYIMDVLSSLGISCVGSYITETFHAKGKVYTAPIFFCKDGLFNRVEGVYQPFEYALLENRNPNDISIIDIKDEGCTTKMYCIYVEDDEHLYLTDNYITTHNTSLAIQIASNIVRQFSSGFVIHYDLEKSTNYTRIGALGRYTAPEMKEGKYTLRQEKCSIEEIKATIAQVYKMKVNNPGKYQYDTGLLDEFGEPIVTYQPTCMIIDSAPKLSTLINMNTKDGIADLETVSSQTDRMRLTAEVGRFLSESLEMLKTANIILFIINHIKDKPPMGVPTAPELPGMSQSETMPMGKALQYYTSYMLRLTTIGSEKYTVDDGGFNGFGATAKMIKNRGNINETVIPLVFDKVNGYDSLRSSISFAKANGLLGGNRNGYYFINNKEAKFSGVKAHEAFAENRELYKIMYAHILPVLDGVLSTSDPSNIKIIEEEFDY